MMESNTFSFALYTPDGVRITFVNEFASYAEVIAETRAALAAGFTVREAGIEAGEHTESISAVMRREWIGKDDKQKRVVDLYGENPALKFKMFTVYMDTAEDVAAFEAATGLRYDSLSIYTNKTAAERDDRNTAQLIRTLATAVKVVYRMVERDEKEVKEFVRWHSAAPAPQPTATPAPVQLGSGAANGASRRIGDDGGGKPKVAGTVFYATHIRIGEVSGKRAYKMWDARGTEGEKNFVYVWDNKPLLALAVPGVGWSKKSDAQSFFADGRTIELTLKTIAPSADNRPMHEIIKARVVQSGELLGDVG